ncbi:MAG: hypothetical protein LWX83_05205 [Anaerolineae bacterium]|nr:hypothetical protein [Anaerolineae bacterium]
MSLLYFWIFAEGLLAVLTALFISQDPLNLFLAGLVVCLSIWPVAALRFFPKSKLSPAQIINSTRPVNLLISLVAVWFYVTLLTVLLTGRLAHWFGPLQSIFTNAWPFFVWFLLALFQISLSLAYRHRNEIFIRSVWCNRSLLFLILWWIILFVTLLHWNILIFNLPLFDMLPGWFWKFIPKDFNLLTLLFIPLVLGVLFLVWCVLNGKISRSYTLPCILLAGVILQVGFGLMEGQGLDSLRLKYLNTAHSSYVELAADRPDLLDALRNYDEHYRDELYLGTKPPGLLAIYLLLQKVSSLILPSASYSERLQSLSALIAGLFPWLSMLVLWPLSAIKRNLDDAADNYLPALIYILSPNLVLIPLFLDQALYPLLFCLGLYLWWLTLKQQSWKLALFSGLYFYLCSYITFSMLPLPALALAWMVIFIWHSKNRFKPAPWIKLTFALLVGLGLACLCLYLTLNYDPFLRYTHAMQGHQTIKSFQSGPVFALETFFVNSLDIAAWSGFPLFLLAVFSALFAGFNWFKNKAAQLDLLLLAFSATYLALNFFGQTRGEVGRIWLFMLPLFCLGAVRQLRTMFGHQQKWVYMLAVLQLVTLFLTFQFQDFFS